MVTGTYLCFRCGSRGDLLTVAFSVWTSATGKEKYDGEWRDDNRHGKGTLTGAAGYSYVGNWKESKVRHKSTCVPRVTYLTLS